MPTPGEQPGGERDLGAVGSVFLDGNRLPNLYYSVIDFAPTINNFELCVRNQKTIVRTLTRFPHPAQGAGRRAFY